MPVGGLIKAPADSDGEPPVAAHDRSLEKIICVQDKILRRGQEYPADVVLANSDSFW